LGERLLCLPGASGAAASVSTAAIFFADTRCFLSASALRSCARAPPFHDGLMKAFLADAGWCLLLCGALIVVNSLNLREIKIARETEAILALGFGFVVLGLSAILAALTRRSAGREQLPPTSRDLAAFN
jgi:hypothetical protein